MIFLQHMYLHVRRIHIDNFAHVSRYAYTRK